MTHVPPPSPLLLPGFRSLFGQITTPFPGFGGLFVPGQDAIQRAVFAPRFGGAGMSPVGQDQIARQVFGGRPPIEWRGMFNPANPIYRTYIFTTASVSAAAGARNVGVGTATGYTIGIPVPSGKTLHLWYISACIETGAVAGSNYDIEYGLFATQAGTYPYIGTLLNQSNGVITTSEIVATDVNTPLVSIAGTDRVKLFYGMAAGSTGGTSSNDQLVSAVVTIE